MSFLNLVAGKELLYCSVVFPHICRHHSCYQTDLALVIIIINPINTKYRKVQLLDTCFWCFSSLFQWGSSPRGIPGACSVGHEGEQRHPSLPLPLRAWTGHTTQDPGQMVLVACQHHHCTCFPGSLCQGDWSYGRHGQPSPQLRQFPGPRTPETLCTRGHVSSDQWTATQWHGQIPLWGDWWPGGWECDGGAGAAGWGMSVWVCVCVCIVEGEMLLSLWWSCKIFCWLVFAHLHTMLHVLVGSGSFPGKNTLWPLWRY